MQTQKLRGESDTWQPLRRLELVSWRLGSAGERGSHQLSASVRTVYDNRLLRLLVNGCDQKPRQRVCSDRGACGQGFQDEVPRPHLLSPSAILHRRRAVAWGETQHLTRFKSALDSKLLTSQAISS